MLELKIDFEKSSLTISNFYKTRYCVEYLAPFSHMKKLSTEKSFRCAMYFEKLIEKRDDEFLSEDEMS